MRNLIVIALVCAILSLFAGLAMHALSMAGQFPATIFRIFGFVSTICHGVPPILLSIVLLNRQES